jgi:EAL and modified HD-GYP domain-containing signal transduction protein
MPPLAVLKTVTMFSLKKLFGKKPAAGAPEPIATTVAPLPVIVPFVRPPPPVPVRPAYAIVGDMPILHRREIIDQQKRLCGYIFTVAYLQKGRRPSESLYFEVLQASGVPGFSARRMVILPVDPEQMEDRRYQVFNAANAFLQFDVRRTLLTQTELVARMQSIAKGGNKLALAGIAVQRTEQSYLTATNLLCLRLDEYPLEQFQTMVRHVRAQFPDVAIMVDQVDSWAEFRMCIDWGVNYCLGSFMTTLDADEGKGEIDQSHLIALQMLNVLRSEGDLEALSELAKKDPGITYKLLGWANSPANGLATTITNLAQAIIILGREELYRWLTVSMYRMGRSAARNESILEIALTRARLLENLPTSALHKRQREDLFIVGLFSLFDVLLEVPMARVLEKIRLEPDVVDVLQNSAGPYARHLRLAILLEKGHDEQAADLCSGLGIDFDLLQVVSMEAFGWSQKALRGR